MKEVKILHKIVTKKWLHFVIAVLKNEAGYDTIHYIKKYAFALRNAVKETQITESNREMTS